MAIYSHSKLETFKKCPFKYKLAYINKIKREEKSIEAFMGTCFHEVMKKLYEEINFKVYSIE